MPHPNLAVVGEPAEVPDRVTGQLAPVQPGPPHARRRRTRDRPPSRRRGWVGRGPVGLVAEEPPKHVRWQARQSGLGWTLWWLLSGAELDGKRRTNATWLRWGTRLYVWSDRMPINWVAWPRAARAVARMAGVVVAVLVARAYGQSPGLVSWVGGCLLWVVLYGAGWAGTDCALLWPHRRRWVWPLHRALVAQLGYPPRTPPRRYLWVSRDFRQPGGAVRVALPPNWTGVDDDADRGEGESSAKALIARVRTKLAFGDIETHWRLTGQNHELVVVPHRDRVPASVLFDAPRVRAWVDESPESAHLLGAGADGPVRVDWDSESPHLLLSMLSGEGKSVLLRGLGAQTLHRGGYVTILDFKRRSQRCFRGVPGVHYCRHPEEMHLALVALAMEGDRRNEEADDWDDSEGEPVFRRHLLIVEEANATIYKLQLWWDLNRRNIADQDVERYCGHFGSPGRPKSPAVLALADILFMGRQTFIHVAAVGQYTTAHAMGGPAIREQFGARGIKGPQKAFAMLAPELDSMPTSRGRRGRIHLVLRGKAVELQVLFMTEHEARDWATSRPAGQHPEDAATRVCTVPVHQGDLARGDATPLPEPASALKPPAPELVTLRQAAAIVNRTHDALRNASVKDPEFPQPAVRAEAKGQPHKYASEDIRRWAQNRGDRQEEVDADPT